jgi:hypothetical protein
MRERCDFHRSTIAIENAFIDYTVFIPLSQHRRVIAASHAHRSRNRIAVRFTTLYLHYVYIFSLFTNFYRCYNCF